MLKLIDLKQYDLVFTTSFGAEHGVSGHLYELIDYNYICCSNNINSAILLTDGTSKDIFKSAIIEKYNFTLSELESILANTFECKHPLLINTQNICIVDGSSELRNCTVFAKNAFLLRCSDSNFEYFANSRSIKQTHLLQDFNLYPERYIDLNIRVVDYVKKILWHKYHQPVPVKSNTALLYLTTNCRILSTDEVLSIINKHSFEKYIIVTNKPNIYQTLKSDSVSVEKAPVDRLFEKFDTYLYTATPKKADCSPRFIVECAVFGKDVIYDIDYVDPGVECRRTAIKQDLSSLQLTNNDYFLKYINQHIRQHEYV